MFNIFHSLFISLTLFFKKLFYKPAMINENEEIYYKGSKLFVVVKNKEIGRNLFETAIEGIKKAREYYRTEIRWYKANFIFGKFIKDKKNKALNCFSLTMPEYFNLNTTISIETKAKLMQAIITAFDEVDYFIDLEKFDYSKCNSISAFISMFSKGSKLYPNKICSRETTFNCFIKALHYFYTGESIESFYSKLTANDNHVFYKDDFPYSYSFAKHCYNLYKNNTTGVDLTYKISSFEYYYEYKKSTYEKDDVLIILDDNIEDNFFKNNELSDNSIILNDSIKIYRKPQQAFLKFIEDLCKLNVNNKELVSESFVKPVKQIYGDNYHNIIGYKFKKNELSYSNYAPENLTQKDICEFIYRIKDFQDRFNIYGNKNDDIIYSSYSILDNIVVDKNSKLTLKVETIEDLFNLTCIPSFEWNEQIVKTFFYLMEQCLKNKTGQFSKKEELLKLNEVRFLSPDLVKLFIDNNTRLSKIVINESIVTAVLEFLEGCEFSDKYNVYYSPIFKTENGPVSFSFGFEIEKEIKRKLRKGNCFELSDGRRVVMLLNRQDNISSWLKYKNSIIDYFKAFEDDHFRLVKLSQLIFSFKDNYSLVGYITEHFEGEDFTEEKLLKMNNVDLYKVFGHLYCNFTKYIIPDYCIRMDNDFVFNVDIFFEENEFAINTKKKYSYVKKVVLNLIDKGYNPCAFAIRKEDKSKKSKSEWFIRLSQNSNSYCNIHKIYFADNSENQCPLCKITNRVIDQNVFDTEAEVLFEDIYAKHYRLDDEYNIKVYNSSVNNLEEIKENLIKITTLNNTPYSINLHQDCFIPYQMAFDSNMNLIGYVYKKENFTKTEDCGNDFCIDINNQNNELNNLAKVKSLVRLIAQIDKIQQNNQGFISNPFISEVFLNTSHKKQVQILNIDLITSRESANKSKIEKWTYDYVFNAVKNDVTLNFKPSINLYKKDINQLKDDLEGFTKLYTKYCNLHHLYYKNEEILCPLCFKESNLTVNDIKYITMAEEKNFQNNNKFFDEGGESFIYKYDKNNVIKFYKKEEIDQSFKTSTMVSILKKKQQMSDINNKNYSFKYIFPKQLVVQQDSIQIDGYIMEKVKDALPISSLRDQAILKKYEITEKDVFEILINIGKGIEELHSLNIFIGDLNGRNILFDMNKIVYFIDFDGMGYDGISPMFYTDGYIDPNSRDSKNITKKDDWYSFAIHAFYYLTYTHPFNGIYYTEYNGKKYLLDTIEKMEKRISLLGNHGIQPPSIAKPWDWMNEDLKKAFLDTFEGERRESLIPELEKQYKTLYSKNASKDITNIDEGTTILKQNSNIIRINSKFTATQIKPYQSEIIRVINNQVALCKDNKGNLGLVFSSGELNDSIIFGKDIEEDIDNVYVSESSNLICFTTKSHIHIYDYKKCIKVKGISVDYIQISYNSYGLYYSNVEEDENYYLHQVLFKDLTDKKAKIGNDPMKKFAVDDKFNIVFIYHEIQKDSIIEQIYMNNEIVNERRCDIKNLKYNILYDSFTNTWSIIDDIEGNVTIIKGTKLKTQFVAENNIINTENIANIRYNKGNLYIPDNNSLWIVNTKKGDQIIKNLECQNIMTCKSILYNFNDKGFNVITNNCFYEIRRG